MGAYGVLDKIKSDSIPDPITYIPTEPKKPLEMEHFFLAYMCLFIGYALSVSAFLAEVVRANT